MSWGCRAHFFQGVMLVIASLVSNSSHVYSEESGLTLEQAVKLNLTSPKVLAAAEAVNQARADARTTALIPNPSLGIEAGLLPLSRKYTAEEPGGPPELGGTISWSIDWLLFGKRSAAIKASDTAVAVAQSVYADVIRQRTFETAEAFYNVLEAQALDEVARRTLADFEQAEAAIRQAVANGGRPLVELSRVRLETQNARRDERSARSALASAKAKLLSIIGQSVDAASVRVDGTLDSPLVIKPLATATAYSLAEENRPDIVALRQRVAQFHQEEVAEGRNAWPETSLGFGISRQFQHSIGALDVTTYGLSLEIALPVFNRNQGQRAKATSASIQAEHELKTALAELHAEVEQAVQSLGAAYENASEMNQTDLALASQVQESFKKAYAVGGKPLVELLDAQRSYRETYRAYIATRAEYWRALFHYQAVLGKKVSP